MIRMSIMGASGTGKETLAVAYSLKELADPRGVHVYDQPLTPRVKVVDDKTKELRDAEIQVEYWAGRTEFYVVEDYYKVDVGIIMYDDRISFEELLAHVAKYRQVHDSDMVPLIALRSRCDMCMDSSEIGVRLGALYQTSFRIEYPEFFRKLSDNILGRSVVRMSGPRGRFYDQDGSTVRKYVDDIEEKKFHAEAKEKLERLGIVTMDCSSFLYYNVDELFQLAYRLGAAYRAGRWADKPMKSKSHSLPRWLMRKFV